MVARADRGLISARDRRLSAALAMLGLALEGSPGGLDEAGVRTALDDFGREEWVWVLAEALRRGVALACRRTHGASGAAGDRWVYFAGLRSGAKGGVT